MLASISAPLLYQVLLLLTIHIDTQQHQLREAGASCYLEHPTHDLEFFQPSGLRPS